jgi:hypothetical protein
MRILVKRHGKGELPAWAWVGAGLGCATGAVLALRYLPFRILPPCGFHLVTGHPCPTCGMTRVGFLLLDGRVGAAFRMNPFLFTIAAALAAWVAVGAALRLAGRDLWIEVSDREEKWGWLALLAGFLLNWAYLWRAGI